MTIKELIRALSVTPEDCNVPEYFQVLVPDMGQGENVPVESITCEWNEGYVVLEPKQLAEGS